MNRRDFIIKFSLFSTIPFIWRENLVQSYISDAKVYNKPIYDSVFTDVILKYHTDGEISQTSFC